MIHSEGDNAILVVCLPKMHLIPIMKKHHRNKNEGHSTVQASTPPKCQGYKRQGKREKLL